MIYLREASSKRLRSAFTLLELILSLALTAVIAGLIGGLTQLYLTNRDTGQESVRQAQLARAILNMISEDVRTTIRYQAFDTSGLEQLLTSGGGGASGGGGGSAGGGSSPAGGASPSAGGSASSGIGGSSGAASGGVSSAGAASGGASSSGASSGGASSSSSSTSTAAPLPPGIYGSSASIEIDVSRLPRPDEYVPRMGDSSLGTLGDMPSDVKTIGYYVQAPRSDGVQDSLGQLSIQATGQNGGGVSAANGGLVRRSLDRSVTQYAYEISQSTQLSRTGELIAPEVLAIEFQYFDGSTWQVQWDSSVQGLPHVVKITIAMQKESYSRTKPIDPGLSISSISTAMMQEYGLEVYSTNTIIPGAQLLVAPQGTTGTSTGSTDSGMKALGLQ